MYSSASFSLPRLVILLGVNSGGMHMHLSVRYLRQVRCRGARSSVNPLLALLTTLIY
jgi:hypothetical protein